MKLIIAIVQERDKHRLADMLLQQGVTFTKLGSTGGFLRQGNVTVLMGVEDEQVDGILEILQTICGTSEQYVNLSPEALVGLPLGTFSAHPVKSESGGAVAFVLPVEQFQRF